MSLTARRTAESFALALFAFLTAAALVWSLWDIIVFPYDGLNVGLGWVQQKGLILAEPRSPALEAGLRQGDRILTVDGLPIERANEIYTSRDPGDSVLLHVEREGEQFSTLLPLTRAPLDVTLRWLEPILIAVIFWSTGLVVWLAQPFHETTRLFALLTQFSTWLLITGSRYLLYPWFHTIYFISLVLFAPLLLHFYIHFPLSPEISHSRRVQGVLRATYAVAALLGMGYLLDLPLLGSFIYPFFAVILLSALLILILSPQSAMRLRDRRRRTLILGMVISLAPLLFLWLLPTILFGTPILADVWTLPFLTFLPLSYAFAVQRGELGQVDLTRGIVYTGLFAALLFVYVLSLLTYDTWQGLTGFQGQALVGIVMAVISALFVSDFLWRSEKLALAYQETLEGWSRALDLRDKETEGHSQRVTDMTVRLARFMGMSEADLVHVRHGALLHDIGKMGVPDQILLKPGKLNDEEWAIMRRHPTFAYEMLASISFLQPALAIPYCHHEKWNGMGYPRGLKEEEIPIAARIFTVVDVWDALTFDRPYRRAWPKEEAIAYIRQEAGGSFDPEVVEAFLKMLVLSGHYVPPENSARDSAVAGTTG